MARKRLPKSIIKKYGITKKAWRVFRGRKKSRSKSSPKRKGRTRSNPRRRGKSGGGRVGRKGKSLAQTAYKLIPALALAAPALGTAMRPGLSGSHKLKIIVRSYTGYDTGTGKFSWSRLGEGWMPFIAASAVVLGVQKLRGILRRL